MTRRSFYCGKIYYNLKSRRVGPCQKQRSFGNRTATPTTRNPQQQNATTPQKDSASQEEKGQHPHTATQRRFLKSQHFYTKCLPRTLNYPRKTSKIRKTTRPADPEEATQSSTSSSRTPNQPPQHPKRVLPGTPRILSVSFYVYSVFFSDVYNPTVNLSYFNQLHRSLIR